MYVATPKDRQLVAQLDTLYAFMGDLNTKLLGIISIQYERLFGIMNPETGRDLFATIWMKFLPSRRVINGFQERISNWRGYLLSGVMKINDPRLLPVLQREAQKITKAVATPIENDTELALGAEWTEFLSYLQDVPTRVRIMQEWLERSESSETPTESSTILNNFTVALASHVVNKL
jgi:hypothetical protein